MPLDEPKLVIPSTTNWLDGIREARRTFFNRFQQVPTRIHISAEMERWIQENTDHIDAGGGLPEQWERPVLFLGLLPVWGTKDCSLDAVPVPSTTGRTNVFLDDLEPIGRPSETWLSQVRCEDLVWLVKERVYARVVGTWLPPDHGCVAGSIILVRLNRTPTWFRTGPAEKWWITERGDGFDGLPLLMPVLGYCRPIPLPEPAAVSVPFATLPRDFYFRFLPSHPSAATERIALEPEPGRPVETPQRSRLRRKHDE